MALHSTNAAGIAQARSTGDIVGVGSPEASCSATANRCCAEAPRARGLAPSEGSSRTFAQSAGAAKRGEASCISIRWHSIGARASPEWPCADLPCPTSIKNDSRARVG
eukprot:scaffold113004_cov32-Tisochrysis_lutea.AAC.7